MSTPVKLNSRSACLPFDGINPAFQFNHFDDLINVGATGDASLAAPYVARTESGANSGTCVVTTATEAGAYGVALSTPGSATGNRIVQEVGNFLPSASNPIIMEARVKFVTGGCYFIGWSEVTATATATVTTAGMAATVPGVGLLIQSDDKGDVVGRGEDDTATTALTDVVTLTAGTWYRIGVRTFLAKSEIYVDGRLVATFDMSAHPFTTKPLTPHAGSCGAGATKILSVDYIQTQAYRA